MSVRLSGVEASTQNKPQAMNKTHYYFVYLLKCADRSYYTGVTNDLQRRIQEHKDGSNRSAYTYHRRPLELVFHIEFENIKEAIAFEKRVKGWSRKKKEALINKEWDSLPKLSECLNSTHFKNNGKKGFA